MLGIICVVTLKVTPIRAFARRLTGDARSISWPASAGRLAAANIGLKFYVLPFRDRVYLDLRTYQSRRLDRYTFHSLENKRLG